MDPGGRPRDLSPMYTSRWTANEVRDSAPLYGGDEPESFPGDSILRDLHDGPEELRQDANEARVARVLARFTAFRSWLMRISDQPPALTDHALEAAAAHLTAAPADWPEGVLLRRLLEVPPDGREAAAVLASAAMHSAWRGEVGGARTLMEAARVAMLVVGQDDGDGPPA